MALKPHVLVVAGSDPTGGAGIARDIETLANFDVRPALAITAITVQTDHKVTELCFQEPTLVAAQMIAALESRPIKAIKIGMIGNASIAKAIAHVLARYQNIQAILDPVLSASSGGKLATEDLIKTIKHALLPHIDLLTPNLRELGQFCDCPQSATSEDATNQTKLLMSNFPNMAVLIKGGHNLDDHCDDILVTDHDEICFNGKRLQGDMRGTGCALSSAIAAGLAKDLDIVTAIRHAKSYVYQRICDEIH